MPRPKGSFKQPSLTLHRASGQAVVRIDGRDRYCGPFGSAEAQTTYDKLIAEWILRGRQPAPDAPQQPSGGPTVSSVIAAFWEHAKAYYADCVLPDGRVYGELDNFRLALRPVRRLYGATPAAKFGPLALKAVRAEMLKARVEVDAKTKRSRTMPGWCRTYANRQVNRIRHVFKWASENELEPRQYGCATSLALLRVQHVPFIFVQFIQAIRVLRKVPGHQMIRCRVVAVVGKCRAAQAHSVSQLVRVIQAAAAGEDSLRSAGCAVETANIPTNTVGDEQITPGPKGHPIGTGQVSALVEAARLAPSKD